MVAEDRCKTLEEIIKERERVIEEHLESLKESQATITRLNNKHQAVNFNVFELDLARERINDLNINMETYLKEKLEQTARIEELVEERDEQTRLREAMYARSAASFQKIEDLEAALAFQTEKHEVYKEQYMTSEKLVRAMMNKETQASREIKSLQLQKTDHLN